MRAQALAPPLLSVSLARADTAVASALSNQISDFNGAVHPKCGEDVLDLSLVPAAHAPFDGVTFLLEVLRSQLPCNCRRLERQQEQASAVAKMPTENRAPPPHL